MSPDHGTGVRYFGVIMSGIELSARIREQQVAERAAKLKYRGVTYYQKDIYGTTIFQNAGKRYEVRS
ncbi:MAG: hypothetical protein Unbinned8622contig1003_43 [Prokaryotic dsDNA virus sp.]|nr:MAG: hypothetical protein Unbinned8622contig1003_43 [Prokaryotic dsDNA virus sp.]